MTGDAPLSHAEVLGRYVGALVDALVAWGLENVCLCPGSRSTPLALAFARHPAIKVWTHLDERSCAYFALGMAKTESLKPVAILCSSGTAALNFAPAVVEAFHARVPLLVLTADRPPELQGVGANQTIDQMRLYGSAVKWFAQVPLPEGAEEMLRYVRVVANRALEEAFSAPQGPVHLNFPFREPLVPASVEPKVLKRVALKGGGLPEGAPKRGFESLIAAQRGVIVCGPNLYMRSEQVSALAERLGWPILADPLSGIRCMTPYSGNVLGHYDLFLRSPTLVGTLVPDFILRVGEPPTSKPLAAYLLRYRKVRQVLVAPPGTLADPDLTASQILQVDPTGLCENILAELDGHTPLSPDWLSTWQDAESRTRAAIETGLGPMTEASEPSAIYDLAEVVPSGHTVFAGNSMPVRDLDSFWPQSEKLNFFMANRGVSGIDGVVSTALGVAAAAYGQVVLVIGDLSFYHDMNGLLAAKRFGLKATIVLVNNDGGGIFSFLPQHDDPEHFEALFGTPHRLDFAPVADLYGVGFQRVTTRDEYKAALQASFGAEGVQIIEIKTDREENLALHQRIWRTVEDAVAPVGAK